MAVVERSGRGVGCRAVSLEVKPVRSRRDLRRFIRLPWRIYRTADPWVPPLEFERMRYLDRSRNPWFEHGEAEFFMAWRDGQPVGRISAQVDHNFDRFHSARWGWFGFYESVDDPRVASSLLDAAEEWL